MKFVTTMRELFEDFSVYSIDDFTFSRENGTILHVPVEEKIKKKIMASFSASNYSWSAAEHSKGLVF